MQHYKYLAYLFKPSLFLHSVETISFASMLPFRRLVTSVQASLGQVHNIQSVQARNILFCNVHKREYASYFKDRMCPASNSGNHSDLIKKIEQFAVKNFKHKYDQELLKEVCSKFLAIGVEEEDLIHTFCQPAPIGGYSDPPVFTMNMSALQKLLNAFVNHDLKPKAIIRVVHYLGSDIKSLTPNQLDSVLMELASLPYLETSITNFLDICPQLISMDAELDERLQTLRSIFPKKELMHLLRNAPNVLTDPWDAVEEKLDYIYKEMGLDQPHIAYNKTMSYSIQHIKDRHEAMVRTGTYKKPKLNLDRLSHLMNEKLEFIMESSDAQFCKRVLKIPEEDYHCFLELLHRERREDCTGLQPDDFEADDEALEQEALRNSYGRRPKRSLSKMPKKDYQRWLQEM